jgi:hypothetical protein
MRRIPSTCFAIAIGLCLVVQAFAAQVEILSTEGGYEVKLDGKPFTTYITKSGPKPILWPILGPTGKEMTRAWPMRDGDPEEKHDHIHHRSFWFTHGNVNGVSFWDENANHGTIAHKEFVKIANGPEGLIVTKNAWVTPEGVTLCNDLRTLKFRGDENTRQIDFESVITSVVDECTFGDTKEGSFGVRVNETMKVDAKKGGKIISSEGLTDGAAWGKPAPWVDYHGPAHGEHLGIAILNHPSSFRFPTHWHVRTYGLFTANPFGLHDFDKAAGKNGSHTLKKGETMTLRYRVIFHKGDEKTGGIAEAYAKYAAEKQGN